MWSYQKIIDFVTCAFEHGQGLPGKIGIFDMICSNSYYVVLMKFNIQSMFHC